MKPEEIVKNSIKKWLKQHNIPYWMIVPSAYGGSSGISDLICILPDGRFLAIEAKKFGGKPTPIQLKFLNTINENKGLAVVVDGDESLALLNKEIYG